MHIYTCKYFALWSKYTHVSKSIFTLCSLLVVSTYKCKYFKEYNTCCTADMYRLLMIAAICYLCTGLTLRFSHEKTIGTKKQSLEWCTVAVKVAFTYDQ